MSLTAEAEGACLDSAEDVIEAILACVSGAVTNPIQMKLLSGVIRHCRIDIEEMLLGESESQSEPWVEVINGIVGFADYLNTPLNEREALKAALNGIFFAGSLYSGHTN